MTPADADTLDSRKDVGGGVPSTFARLAELSRRRDWNTGRYADPTLNEEIDQRLRSAHEKAFAEWLGYSLEQKRAGLELYFSGLDCPKALVFQTWKRLRPYRSFVPTASDPTEEQLFLCDLEAMIEVMSNEICPGAEPAGAHLNWRVRAVLVSAESRSGDVRLTLKVVSQGLRVSPYRLGMLFRQATGFAFRDYLRMVRMRRSVELLRDPNLTAAQVSRTLGHNKPSNFVHEFHEYFGVTPGNYRLRNMHALFEPGQGPAQSLSSIPAAQP